MNPTTLPGLRGMEHIGFTVPDLEQATRVIVDGRGCEVFDDLGHFQSEEDWMEVQLNGKAGAVMGKRGFFRCGHGSKVEIFE